MIRITLDVDESILPELEVFKKSLNSRIIGTPLRGGGVISISVDVEDPAPLIQNLLANDKVKSFCCIIL